MPAAPHAPSPVPDSARAAIAALFDDAVATHRTSGVTWAVIGGHAHAEPVLAHGAAGAQRLDDGVAAGAPMSRGTVSRIASMTKSFTAATILALRDEGRLRLDDPVARHLPEAADAFETGPTSPP